VDAQRPRPTTLCRHGLWSGWPASFFDASATPASVVIIRPAMEAASCKAMDGLGGIDDAPLQCEIRGIPDTEFEPSRTTVR
jgi:hypothetical protein